VSEDGIAVQDEWFHQRYDTIVVIFLLFIFHFSRRTSDRRVMTCKNIAKESFQKKGAIIPACDGHGTGGFFSCAIPDAIRSITEPAARKTSRE